MFPLVVAFPKHFSVDRYAILNILPGAPDSQIKVQYRTLSLLIHPDKSSNPSAPTAFDRLKKAQIMLLDTAQRQHLDESIADARTLLLRERKLTVDSPDAQLLNEEGEMKDAWRRKTVEVLVEAEARRRKQLRAKLQEEGREMKKAEEEIEGRKRRREHEAEWEATREGRIGSWRDWKKGSGKGGGDPKGKESDGKEAPGKKKKKLKVLG